MVLTPSYPGARSLRGFAFPYLDGEYHDRFYISATDLFGVYAYKTEETQLGAAIQYDFTERISSDDGRLKGFADVKATPRAKLFASQTFGFIIADANVATDIGGHGQGTIAQANLSAALPWGKAWLFVVGPGVTWADQRYMSTFYSVTPAQGAASDLPAYATHAGILDLHLNAAATVQLSTRWSLGAQVYEAWLQGSAAASPITQKREQLTAFAWAAYRLR